MSKSLKQAYQNFGGDTPDDIPWIVWLLENPESPLALGGAIDLRRHDYLHILFDRGFTADDEAFVIGVTMGNSTDTNIFHYWIFKIASLLLYPGVYRLKVSDLATFNHGVQVGRSLKLKNLNTIDFSYLDGVSIEALRQVVGIDLAKIQSKKRGQK